MNKDDKYRPENIEKLLLSKSFAELLDSEKSYVLKHVDSEEEYESMRALLAGVETVAKDQHNRIKPPHEFKKELMLEFEKRAVQPKSRHFSFNRLFVSLTSFLSQSFSLPVYKNPVLRYALAAILLVTGFFIIQQNISPVIENELAGKTQETGIKAKVTEKTVNTEPVPIKSEVDQNIREENKTSNTEVNMPKEIDIPADNESETVEDEIITEIPDYSETDKITKDEAITKKSISEQNEIQIENTGVEMLPESASENISFHNSKGPAMRKNKQEKKDENMKAGPVARDEELIRILLTTW